MVRNGLNLFKTLDGCIHFLHSFMVMSMGGAISKAFVNMSNIHGLILTPTYHSSSLESQIGYAISYAQSRVQILAYIRHGNHSWKSLPWRKYNPKSDIALIILKAYAISICAYNLVCMKKKDSDD